MIFSFLSYRSFLEMTVRTLAFTLSASRNVMRESIVAPQERTSHRFPIHGSKLENLSKKMLTTSFSNS